MFLNWQKAAVLLLLLGCAYFVPAQTACYLHLRVTDSQSGETLEGASLRIDGKNTRLLTDTAGTVRVPITCEEHAVKIQMVGYRPFARRLEIDGDEVYPVELETISSQIEEVVVTSQAGVRTLETPALGVSLLSMKAVQKISPAAGEVDILRSLQTLPGISAVGEGANGVNIRGGAVEQNLILLDNMPVYNPTHLLGLFSLFPNDAIREMQIYKGSVPARYGGRTAAVLDVRMSEPSTEHFKMRGGAGLISNRLHAEIPVVKEKVGWMISARCSFNEYLIRFYNSAIVGNFAERKIPNNKPAFLDMANKVTLRITPNDHLTFTQYFSYDSYRVDTLFTIANIVPRQATMQYGHNNFALRWNHYYSDQLNLNVLAVRSRYQTATFASDVRTAFDYDTQIDHYNAKAELTWAPNTAQRINTGATVTRYEILPAALDPREGSLISSVHLPKEQAWETALFAADEYEINERILIEPGLRLVYYANMGPAEMPVYSAGEPFTSSSITGYESVGKGKAESVHFRLEPRLAMRYKINSNNSVKVGYNRMNQFLQMLSNNTTPLPNVRWKTSNRFITPGKSDLVSAGLFHDSKSRMWEWSVESYYRWQGSIFDYLNSAQLNINPEVETQLLRGKGKSYGAELLLNKKKGTMTGWMSYTYARSLQQITGDFPMQQQLNNGDWFRTNIDKPHTLNILLSFQSEKHNAASFTFVYSTGRPYTAPVSFYQSGLNIVPVYSERNNARISAYHRLDFSWTIFNPSMKERRWESSWVITIYNLYGRKNAFSYFFNPELASFQPFKVSVFPTPLFSLTYNFKFE